MRSPHSLRNGGGGGGGGGGTPSPHARIPTPHHHFHSTVSVQKLKRFNSLILVFRLSTFCFSLASAVFMITNSRGSGSDSPRWYDFDAFRYVFAANAIVAVYSLFEMIASVWEISREVTLFPEILQVWFDFGHDQAFAYLLLSADSAGTALAITLKGTDTCKVTSAFCVQSTISIALGFAGFLFLGLSSLLSGFRVVCFVINGSRFHF
ncbi:CASP-like protein 4C1 isoform X3 [Cucumis melo var. makuwa]|uniref:CASP-like protein n=1 Tax=Cucumis melo var. makuwa TaxID=1194695 RepID=A0A5D3BVM1_CUCMM|nr:CASP-like protein 4C1 isoform X3 [Cucumis melo var. makuwa]TYK03527.1 CASP-like protein 4C1 isoform X3 [Cucumis melo var. makuwa]